MRVLGIKLPNELKMAKTTQFSEELHFYKKASHRPISPLPSCYHLSFIKS